MIYSENAPELETKLHKTFENKRVNFYNNRKEFFKVSLEDIEKELKENFPEIEMIKIPEAKEYRESCALIDKMNNVTVQVPELEKFPKSLI
jgi:vacuolar-type H+-ATPase subunit D/Vma8